MDRFAIKMMVLLVVAGSLPPLGSGQAAPAKPPTIIGHRGAPGYLPEHTLEGYSLAIDQGADFIEPDLVISRDGVLFARHENEISGTTDVAKKFPGRRGSKKVDGRMRFGWFLEDFTAAEVGTLRARERLSFRDQSKNGLYGIPTFREIITLVQKKSRKLGRKIGIYPELKHSTYFRGIGLPLEEPLVGILRETGFDHPQAPIFIQSFEVSNLRALKTMTRAPLIQLIGRPGRRPYDFIAMGDARTYGDLIGPEGLKEIAGYARGIGARKQQLLS
ncbi:MAG: glycerophosphodiester phosphodiesterase family protein, partial [bacterium]